MEKEFRKMVITDLTIVAEFDDGKKRKLILKPGNLRSLVDKIKDVEGCIKCEKKQYVDKLELVKKSNENVFGLKSKLIDYINYRIHCFSSGGEFKGLNELSTDGMIIDELIKLKNAVNKL